MLIRLLEDPRNAGVDPEDEVMWTPPCSDDEATLIVPHSVGESVRDEGDSFSEPIVQLFVDTRRPGTPRGSCLHVHKHSVPMHVCFGPGMQMLSNGWHRDFTGCVVPRLPCRASLCVQGLTPTEVPPVLRSFLTADLGVPSTSTNISCFKAGSVSNLGRSCFSPQAWHLNVPIDPMCPSRTNVAPAPSFTQLRWNLAARVRVTPEHLDRPELRTRPIMSFDWVSGHRTAGAVSSETGQYDRMAIFDVQSHARTRPLPRGWSIEHIVADMLGLFPQLRQVHFLQRRVPGFPSSQIAVTTRAQEPGHFSVPLDFRPFEGRVCTTSLAPGYNHDVVHFVCVRDCPHDRLPRRHFVLVDPDGNPFAIPPLPDAGPDFAVGIPPDAMPQAGEVEAAGPDLRVAEDADEVVAGNGLGLFQIEAVTTGPQASACPDTPFAAPSSTRIAIALTDYVLSNRTCTAGDDLSRPSNGSKVGTLSSLARLQPRQRVPEDAAIAPRQPVTSPLSIPSSHPGDPPSLLSAGGVFKAGTHVQARR